MRALVYHGIGNIRFEEVSKPTIQDDYDAIVKITTSAICGTDLHFIRGTVGPMKKGTILGHEAVGVVEEVGSAVKNFREGERVIIPSTVACGYCEMCHLGFYSQCNQANPNGPEAGTAFFGGPEMTGPLQGCQAEYVRVPFANHNLVKLPDRVRDDQAILLSDIFPTAYFSVDIAGAKTGDVAVVLGCGPVGQFAIASCKLRGVSRIIAIDAIPSRLDLAKKQGAECINFNEEEPLAMVKELTNGLGANVVIDAVGIDAYAPEKGPAAKKAAKQKGEFEEELSNLVPAVRNDGPNWIPGNAPSYTLREAVDLVAKCGTVSIIGVYPQNFKVYPIGKAMNKNLKLVMGNCPHRAYIPKLLAMVEAGLIDPTGILTQQEPLTDILEAYKQFDLRKDGWIKVALTV
ncbi:zinc-dependent alcohol dehydrogenase [Legionella jordanis]|uniref:Threonine(-3-)dehydrogenase n=1 Tax=Legionella jordanis TaxID=456 RepID=A0A0W0VB12_9GAMM|nr:zinc-dependent alcohol dehydrogenase [Legionella jordanis]KTD17301.1 threonine(-3-)dehydrogenase [Legionella jordanis]RMW99456.1 glutathione-dependent formaldehyde dehydrogenase [Legionella jordanis]RMX15305.1 glutathione-dependent formaldehyde dehydrogenase [Legionella jordanis]VEH12500.1 threonine(-3-)dehydrogenase [Legionella jordanis]HAT8715226.1 alcohol dehydrogenase catalytic domain-containing protein [Legionella jordanis]